MLKKNESYISIVIEKEVELDNSEAMTGQNRLSL